MEEEFVSYEQALELEKLGCQYATRSKFGIYQENGELRLNRPLKQQAFRFFREKYSLVGFLDIDHFTEYKWFIRIDNFIMEDIVYHSAENYIIYSTYEEAEEACLDKLIEIAKDIKKGQSN